MNVIEAFLIFTVGLAGGSFIVPALFLIFDMPAKNAVATTIVAILCVVDRRLIDTDQVPSLCKIGGRKI